MNNTRFAQLFSDGSLNVSNESEDLLRARELLAMSSADDDTELVEVEIRIIRSHGKPKLQVATEHSKICDTCHSTVYFTIEDLKADLRIILKETEAALKSIKE